MTIIDDIQQKLDRIVSISREEGLDLEQMEFRAEEVQSIAGNLSYHVSGLKKDLASAHKALSNVLEE